MKRNRNTISPRFDRWILLLSIISIGIIVSFIATDHLPAWTPTWGTIYETANNFAISFLVTTVFYIFTVYRPEKKKYEYASLLLQNDKKQLDRAIRGLGIFIIAQANAHSSEAGISLEAINQHSLNSAQEVFATISDDDPVWESLYRQISDLEEQTTIFSAKYSEYVSTELNDDIRLFLDNTTFHIVRTASNRTQLLKKDNLLSDYFYSADKLMRCTNLMDNAKRKR